MFYEMHLRRRSDKSAYVHNSEGADKKPVFDDLIKKLNLQPHEVAFMGDDLIDLPVLKAVGCAACPNDAISEVKSVCNFISHHNGGCGAVRELCDAVWEAQHPCAG